MALTSHLSTEKRASAIGLKQMGSSLALAHSAGLVGTLLGKPSRDYYRRLDKPPYSPPGWLFGVVWPILYTQMGLAHFLVRRRGQKDPRYQADAQRALRMYSLQWILNSVWSALFFGMRSPFIALAEIALLWTSIVATIRRFGRVSRLAAWLLVPYLAWTSFAALLNFEVWRRNPGKAARS